MPRLLKNDTIRLLEASIESLGLAQIGICSFRRDQLKIEQVRYSPEIGLIGSSIELAMSSILIQALGKKSIFKDYKSGRYKTASEILSDFRALLRQSSNNILFLTNGISKPDEFLKKIIELTNRFQIIITSRANGLHNGYGLSYEIVASLFQDVTKFLKLLSESNNFKPYLIKIPELVGIKLDNNILVDDLYDKLEKSKNLSEQKSILTSLFLILPEIPQKLPEWIEKFESLNIAPKKNDIVYLIDALEKANPVTLNKVKDGSNPLNVKIVGRDDENAIPISAQFLKSEFTQFRDQFYADIATANGRLSSKALDLPPKSSIYYSFSSGLIDAKIIEENTKLTAHQSWSFIVEANNVSKSNTPAPYWFLIRNTEDLPQLKALLKTASKYGNSSLKKNITIILAGIDTLEKDTAIDANSIFVKNIIFEIVTYANNFDVLERLYNKNGLNGLPEEYKSEFDDFFNGEKSITELISKILEEKELDSSCKKYWIAKLTSIMPEIEDLPLFYTILHEKEYSSSHTNIRKIFRAMDFNLNGPKINTQ
ncbi:hypothetical protein LZZ90_01295 [Flavobacterium sp. SM15]|uniref:hypothetical protein n=1 Tax=Flavobacterium sp. SM15 TaxID=2908005 RepID=UPI001EDC81BE|nr:hypothetical protein [Flavobacterium sp. SM15]MCG2610136.1 hypothetical protein [Flavobacterium sp. SM15]